MSTLCQTQLKQAEHNVFQRALAAIRNYLHTRKMQRIDRDAFRHLASLDESLLKDIGVTREDVEWAMKLPTSQNASDELQQLSRGYRKRA